MKVVYSRLALAELDEILSYIRSRSPAGARRVEVRLRQVVDRIAEHPEGAEQVADAPGVHRAPLIRYPYVVYYEVFQGRVVVLRILHGSRRRPWPD